MQTNGDKFDIIYNNILEDEENRANRWLSKHGFKLIIIKDYEEEASGDIENELYQNSVGIFCNDIQKNASEFPIYINKDIIYNYLSERGLEEDKNEIRNTVNGTIWHEIGHGIINYLGPEYEYNDEEEAAEEFSLYRENSEIYDDLMEYENEI